MEQRELTTERKDKGFTLVELLIVIVILGILATVVVFAVANVTEKAQENACGVEEKTLVTAIESFKAENPGVAVTLAGVQAYLTDGWPTATWDSTDLEPPLTGIGKCAPGTAPTTT